MSIILKLNNLEQELRIDGNRAGSTIVREARRHIESNPIGLELQGVLDALYCICVDQGGVDFLTQGDTQREFNDMADMLISHVSTKTLTSIAGLDK